MDQSIQRKQNCPQCQQPMIAQAAAGGWTPEGFTPQDDHWWCGDCEEVVLFEDVTPTPAPQPAPTNDEIRRQLGPTGKEKTR